MSGPNSRAGQYIRRAAEFAEKAETATDVASQITYRSLAEAYRRLSGHAFPSASDAEIEAMARRIVGKSIS